MSESILVRQPIDPKSKIDLDEQLHDKAKSLLGYHCGQVSGEKADLEIERALADAGVRPFTQESVDEYKSTKQSKTLDVIAWSVVVIAVIGAIAGIIGLTIGACHLCGIGESIAVAPFGCGFGVCLCLCVVGLMIAIQIDEQAAKWTLVPIKQYASPIPEFALQTAVDLHERNKKLDLDFRIDELRIQQRLDPFLVVVSKSGKRYYLEVWNEPGFKAKRGE